MLVALSVNVTIATAPILLVGSDKPVINAQDFTASLLKKSTDKPDTTVYQENVMYCGKVSQSATTCKYQCQNGTKKSTPKQQGFACAAAVKQ